MSEKKLKLQRENFKFIPCPFFFFFFYFSTEFFLHNFHQLELQRRLQRAPTRYLFHRLLILHRLCAQDVPSREFRRVIFSKLKSSGKFFATFPRRGDFPTRVKLIITSRESHVAGNNGNLKIKLRIFVLSDL